MKTTRFFAVLSLVLGGTLLALASTATASHRLDWTEQLGTSSDDFSLGVSADGLGNVFISGSTRGSLRGTNAGGEDAFVSKYDASGTLDWTRQLGTSLGDRSNGVSADGLGNVYVSGRTFGSLKGTNAGRGDALVAKFTDMPNLFGDFDDNDFVDGEDFLMWQRDSNIGLLTDWEANYGTIPIEPGDFDGSGEVNGLDFLRWQRDPSVGELADWEMNYGMGATLSASSAAVPEPASVLLLATAVGALLLRSRRW